MTASESKLERFPDHVSFARLVLFSSHVSAGVHRSGCTAIEQLNRSLSQNLLKLQFGFLLCSFLCGLLSVASMTPIKGNQDVQKTPNTKTSESPETVSWDIPERLLLNSANPRGQLSSEASACSGCLEDWQAVDIAKAYLKKYPIKFIDVRAEVLTNFRWRGGDKLSWRRTDEEWYYGYKIGLRYNGESPPLGSQKVDTEGFTWRVWYQIGWIEENEIASRVKQNQLPLSALEWERQPLEEFILVHARTGRIAPVRTGRENTDYLNRNPLYPLDRTGQMPFLDAIRAAKERAELWISQPHATPRSQRAP